MSKMSKAVLGFAGLGLAAALAFGATAQAASMKAATGPQDGDCKATYSMAAGQNPAVAQALWVNAVKAQYGSKWSHWVGAKNKAIIFVGGGAATQYQARAMPCFYQPVP